MPQPVLWNGRSLPTFLAPRQIIEILNCSRSIVYELIASGQIFSNLIYTVSEGKEKLRLTDQSTFQPTSEWRTTIISTGEFSLLERSSGNTGLRVRILEMSGRWTDDASHADALKNGLRKNCGHAGPMFANYLRKVKWEAVSRVWAMWKSRVVDTLPSSPFRERIAGRIALVLTSAHLINKSLGLGLNVDEILVTLTDMEKANPTESVDERAYDAFQQWVSQNIHTFRPSDRVKQNGLIQEGFVFITTIAFKRAMNELGFEGATGVLTAWKNKGLLRCDPERKTVKKVLSPHGGRVLTYCIKMETPDAIATDAVDGPGSGLNNSLGLRKSSDIRRTAGNNAADSSAPDAPEPR